MQFLVTRKSGHFYYITVRMYLALPEKVNVVVPTIVSIYHYSTFSFISTAKFLERYRINSKRLFSFLPTMSTPATPAEVLCQCMGTKLQIRLDNTKFWPMFLDNCQFFNTFALQIKQINIHKE